LREKPAFHVGRLSMKTSNPPFGRRLGTILVVALVASLGASAVVLALPSSAHSSSSGLSTATGATQQWAFGGSASASYSCSDASCYAPGSGTHPSLNLSFRYYLEWVVIYTETNVSSTQTELEGQVALNASVSLSLSSCVVVKTGSPCESESLSLSVSGRESAYGFTNLTTGSVNLTAAPSGPLGSTPAWAITNASSHEAFNFSGSFSGQIANAAKLTSLSASLDFGASETSSIAFATPLGIVPLNPQPGDNWTSGAAFQGHGSYVSGSTISYTLNGTSNSLSNWTSRAVAPSGQLNVSGSDLGTTTLWDNYTAPPTSATAQEILLVFSSGDWIAANGWLMVPTGFYAGALAGASAAGSLAHVESGRGLVAAASSIAAPSGESVYYQKGVGIVGAGVSGSTSSLGGTGTGLAAPSIHLQAGPEPVSLAESQYSAILSSPSSSGGSPIGWILLAVVVVVVVLLVVVLLSRRSRKAAAAPPAAASGALLSDGTAPDGSTGSPSPSLPTDPTAPH